jgi:hypothetical protein
MSFFSWVSGYSKQVYVLICVYKQCEAFLRSFLGIHFMSSGKFNFCVCDVCVCVSACVCVCICLCLCVCLPVSVSRQLWIMVIINRNYFTMNLLLLDNLLFEPLHKLFELLSPPAFPCFPCFWGWVLFCNCRLLKNFEWVLSHLNPVLYWFYYLFIVLIPSFQDFLIFKI